MTLGVKNPIQVNPVTGKVRQNKTFGSTDVLPVPKPFEPDINLFEDTWSTVFSDKDLETTYNALQQGNQVEVDDFLGRLQKVGRTPETINLLKTIVPEVTDEQLNEIFFNPLDFSGTKTGIPAYETFRQGYYQSKGWTDYGDVQSLSYKVPFKESDPRFLEALQQGTEAFQEYQKVYGKGQYLASSGAKALEFPFPTISKLMNPEKPDIKWYDPLWDLSTLLSFGAIGATGTTAKLALRGLDAALSSVAIGATTIDNWENMSDAEKILNLGLTGLSLFGVKMETIPTIKMALKSKTSQEAAQLIKGFMKEVSTSETGTAFGKKLTPEAEELLAKVEKGGAPLGAVTPELERIAFENGITATPSMTAKGIIDKLKEIKGGISGIRLPDGEDYVPRKWEPPIEKPKPVIHKLSYNTIAEAETQVDGLKREGYKVSEIEFKDGQYRITVESKTLTEGLPEEAHVEPTTMAKEITVPVETVKKTTGVTPVSKEGYIGNIKTSKFADDVLPDIKYFAENNPEVVGAVRRGTVSFSDTQKAAEDLILKTGGDPKKLVRKVGSAYNDAEIRAIGGMLSNTSNEINTLRKTMTQVGGDTIQNQLKLAQLIEKHNYFQLTAHASRAEAGRALSSLRMLQQAIDSNSNPIMEKVLRTIGKEHYEEALKAMQGLNWDDPVQINNFIRQFKQPKLMDYVNEIFINSILSGPKTHMVNVITNNINTLMSPLERGVSSVIERGLSKLQGRTAERFLAEVPEDILGAIEGIPEGTKGFLQTMRSGVSPSDASKWEFRVPAFKGKLGRVINFPTTALGAADNLNYSINYRQAFNAEALRLGKSMGKTGDDLVDFIAETKINPPADMVEKASEIANYRLFRGEDNGLASILYKFRDWGFEVPKVGKVTPLKFVIPFVRTPVNLFKYGLERSPLGFFNPKLIENIAKKSPEAADQIARAFIGSTLSASVALLFAEDKITGAVPTSTGERDRFYREGKQPYSVKIGNTWFSYQRLEPFNTAFTLVAIAVDAIKEDDTTASEKAMDAVASFTKNFVSQTYMSGLADIMDIMQDPEKQGGNILQSTGQALLVPGSSMMRTVTQGIDPTIRQPTGFKEKLESGVPFLSYKVPPKLNVFGETTKRQTPWFSPISITTEDDSALNTELNKYDINIGFVGNSINNVELDDKQKREYQELAGQMAKTRILSLIKSPEYQAMNDKQKEAAIFSEANSAKEDARTELVEQGIVPSNQDDLKTLNGLRNKLGSKILPLPLLADEKPEIYGVKQYFSEARQLLKKVKPTDVKDPLLKAVIEASGYKDEVDKRPNETLISLDSDQIISYLKKGGISKRDAELLEQYHSLPNSQKYAFIQQYPQLKVNPQLEWLKVNVQANALLSVFEQKNAVTSEARALVQKLVETLDIPDIAKTTTTKPSTAPKSIGDYLGR
jgi:hypothetical protein